MNYLFKENRLYKFDNNIIVETQYESNNVNACIDETGFKLFDQLDRKNAFTEGKLLKVGKSLIKTIEAQMPTFDEEYTSEFEVDLDALKEASKFADTRETNPILTGVYVNDLGTIIATDRFKVYSLNKGTSNKYIVLSKELVDELIKHQGKAILKFNTTNARTIINDSTIITGRLLAGNYPNVSQLLKLTQGYELKNIDKQELLSKINLGKLVGGEVNIYFNQNEITFYGDNEYNSILENSKLDNFNLYINLDYFNITLNVLKNNNVELYYKSELAPIIFTENDKMMLVMPMKRM